MTLIILAAVFLSVLVITPLGIAYARKTGKLDKPTMRKIHTDPTPSIGGHVFIPAAFIGWWLLIPEIDSKVLSLTASAAILYVMGIFDDARNLSHKIKLPIQIAASTIVIYVWDLLPLVFGIHIIHSWWGWILILAFFQFTINAINYIDGVNGLLGSQITISFGYIFFGLQTTVDTELMTSILAGLFAFLIYNFRTKALVFMGDTGSTVIGLIVALIAARYIKINPTIQYGPNALPSFYVLVGIFWYPLFDSLRVYSLRLIRKRSLFKADTSHFHHLLLNHFKMNHLFVSLFVALISILILSLISYFKSNA